MLASAHFFVRMAAEAVELKFDGGDPPYCGLHEHPNNDAGPKHYVSARREERGG